MLITSVNNDKIKELVKLKNKKYRDENNLFFVEGLDLISEAYKNNSLKELYLLENTELPFEINHTYISKEVMKKISDMESISPYYGVCEKKENNKLGNRILILDNIQDPGNLGTIIRSSIAFSFDNIILSENTVDIYNPKTIRSTKGMLFNANIQVKNLKEFICSIKDYDVYGTDVNNGIDIKNESFNEKIAIVIGNEGQGISKEVKELCKKNIYLKMSSACESLNAAVAASIIMYEVNNK